MENEVMQIPYKLGVILLYISIEGSCAHETSKDIWETFGT